MTPEIKAVILIIMGLIMCFGGYKIQKLIITITWFAFGFTITETIGAHFIEANNILLIISLIVGVLLGSVGFKLEKLAIFLAVAYLTFITIGPYIQGFEEGIRLIVQGVASLLVGALAVFMFKPIIIFVTSIAGAQLIKDAVPVIANVSSNILLIAVIVIAILGIAVQFKNN